MKSFLHFQLLSRFILIANICCLSSFSYAQCSITLKGKVVDKENNLPISYVLVRIAEINLNTSTDSLGQFTFENLCADTYTFVCQRIGFKQTKDTLPISASSHPIFLLEFDPSVFHSVEIEGKKSNDAAHIRNSIEAKQLELSQGNSLADALKTISGVNNLGTGHSISKPVIHGLHSNRILILNNGVRQEGQQWGSEHAPEIDPLMADKLTVLKGSSGLMYGHDAMGGVILVEPKDFRTTSGINGKLNLIGSSNGRSGLVAGMIEGCFKMLPSITWRAQGTLKQSGNIHTPNYYLKNTGAKEYNYSLSAGYRHRNFNASIFYSQFNTDIAIFSGSHIGNLTDLQTAIHSESPLDTSGFSYHIGRPKQHIEHELFKAKLNIFTSEKSKLTFVYARQYNLREEYDKHLPRNDSLAALNKPELHLEITTNTADIQFDKQFNSRFKIASGINATYQGNTYEGRYFIPNFIQRAGGIYVIGYFHKNKISAELAQRFDMRELQVYRYENGVLEKPVFEYKHPAIHAGITYEFTEQFHATANVGSTWRAPQASELYSNGLHHGAASIEIGDVKLTRERAWSAQGSLQYTNKILQVEIVNYINYFDGYIYLAPQLPATLTIRGAFPTFVYQQANVIMHGTDLTCTLNINKKNELHTTGSLVRAVNASTSEWISQIPADKYTFSIDHILGNTGLSSRTHFIASGIFVNRQWRIAPNTDYLSTPASYVLLNLELNSEISIAKNTMLIGFSVNNALNKRYRDYMNRFRYFSDEMGRNITIRISIPLNKNTPS